MKYNILTIALCLLFAFGAEAKEKTGNKGFRIEVDAPHKKGSTIYLAKYWDGNTYIHDSLKVSNQGKALFFSQERLPAGQYLIYIKPDIQIDLLIDKEQSDIRITINENDLLKSTISGSKDSELFWKHIAYIREKAEEKNKLEKQLNDSTATEQKRNTAQEQLNALDEAMEAYTKSQIEKHRNDWFGIFLKGMTPISIPFPQPRMQAEVNENRRYGKVHFFDNIDLTDPRFWHTNFFTSYIDSYMEQWVEPVPDSLASAANNLVAKTKGNDFCFKEMLSRLTNQSIQSPIMGHENIWAKLAEEYIFDKNISWIDSTQLSELKKGYARIQYNRIGMRGHDLTLETIDGKSLNTGNIVADYLVLYFYDPNCAHCQKASPLLHDNIYAKYKNKGIEIVAIDMGTDKDEWHKFVNDNKLTDWINAADPTYKSEYWMYYDTSAIPTIFVLDKNKKIIAKKIDEESLDRFFEYYIKN